MESKQNNKKEGLDVAKISNNQPSKFGNNRLVNGNQNYLCHSHKRWFFHRLGNCSGVGIKPGREDKNTQSTHTHSKTAEETEAAHVKEE